MKIKFQQIAEFLIYTAIIGVGISYGKLYLFHIIALLFVLFFSFRLKTYIKEIDFSIHFKNTLPFLLIFVLWYALSIIWATDKILSIYYLFYLGCGLLIVFAFYFSKAEKLHRIIKFIGIIIIVEMLIALLESFTAFRYPISPYSDLVVYFQRNIGYSITLSPEIITAIKNTPTGFRWNPNNLAATMILAIPFFLFYKKLWISIVFSLTAIVIIFLTGSRGVLVALIFMFAFYFILYINKKQKIIVSAIMLTVVIVFIFLFKSTFFTEKYRVKKEEISSTIIAFNNYLFTPTNSTTTDNNIGVKDTSSITIRRNLIKNGIDAFKESYALGVGGGNSQRVQMMHDNTHNTSSMHNFWIEVLVEGGIIAFILFVGFYILLIIRLIQLFRRKENAETIYVAKASSLALIGFSVGMISISSAVYFFPMWIIFGIGISLLKKSIKKLEK